MTIEIRLERYRHTIKNRHLFICIGTHTEKEPRCANSKFNINFSFIVLLLTFYCEKLHFIFLEFKIILSLLYEDVMKNSSTKKHLMSCHFLRF